MKPDSACTRILAALRLQPMTPADLIKTLSLRKGSVYMAMVRLRRSGLIACCGQSEEKAKNGFLPWLWKPTWRADQPQTSGPESVSQVRRIKRGKDYAKPSC